MTTHPTLAAVSVEGYLRDVNDAIPCSLKPVITVEINRGLFCRAAVDVNVGERDAVEVHLGRLWMLFSEKKGEKEEEVREQSVTVVDAVQTYNEKNYEKKERQQTLSCY